MCRNVGQNVLKMIHLIPRAVACLVLLVWAAGCASLPGSRSISEGESKRVGDSFAKMVERSKECSCCVDSGVALSWDSPFVSGNLDGYLQAREPSYVRFVAVNPLGQPWIIFVTDGRSFSYVPVSEGKVFEGDVLANSYAKMALNGLDPQNLFYFLTGRIGPGEMRVVDIARHENLPMYWLKYVREGDPAGMKHHALYDPKRQRLKEYVLEGDGGGVLAQARYVYNWAEKDYPKCPFPTQVLLSFPGQHGAAEIKFRETLADVTLAAADFELKTPEGFTRVPVQ